MRMRADKRAFSLVEIMTVLVIVALAAALIIPALQHYQIKAGLAACMSKGKAIAQAVQAYTSENNGYSCSTDEDYYVVLMGYRVDYPTTEGYFGEAPGWASNTASQSYQHAQSIKDFTCPIDGSPDTNRHACKTSYRVGYSFRNGKREFKLFKSETIVVAGRRSIHQTDEGSGRLYVYGNGSAEFVVRMASGLWCRGWNSGMSDWNAIKNNTHYEVPEMDEPWDSNRDFYASRNASQFDFLPTRDRFGVAIPEWDSSGVVRRFPRNIILRWDGFISVSQTGSWRLRLYAETARYLWIDLNGNGIDDSNERMERMSGGQISKNYSLQAGQRYRFAAMYGVGVPGGSGNTDYRSFDYQWRDPSNATTRKPTDMFHDAQ